MNVIDEIKIGIFGLGYVGLPLAAEFGKHFSTQGYDINPARVAELVRGLDSTLECSSKELEDAIKLTYTSTLDDLKDCNVYIVTVPTPIDEHKQPDLTPLIKASEALGQVISHGDVIIYESTVYPGATEDDCIPVVERVSGLKFNEDFYAGYSPERINPGDKQHRVINILKVTSGSTPEVAGFVDELYKKIITAGTHKASSIKVAEAAKVIENTQRDVNIALINELYQIFSRMGIDTKEVIEAASTKWNFMKLMPGLVGGHCISVDPYYLLHKSSEFGYVPDLMRTAREINDSMPEFLTNEFLRGLISNNINPRSVKIALLGFTFKENCPDIRNTKSYDLFLSLVKLGLNITIIDDWADEKKAEEVYGIKVSNDLTNVAFDAALILVGHDSLIDYAKKLKNDGAYVFDFKGYLN